MLENYLVYLRLIDNKLTKFFNKQKPYIFCKKGCGRCCKKGQFPYTQIEMVYLLHGAKKLDDEKIELIMGKIKKIKEEKLKFTGKKFLYDCPFLINNECSVYDYRGLICRSFGLWRLARINK